MLARFLGLVFAVLILGAACVAGAFMWANGQFTKPLNITEPLLYDIPQGASLHSVALDLQYRKMLDRPRIYTFATRILGMDDPIKAGEYQLTAGMSARDVLELFQSGSNFQRFVTVREGLTSYETVQLLKADGDLSGEVTEIPAEGSLLPETYSHRRDEPRSAVIARMQAALTKVLDEAWGSRVDGLPLKTKAEALVLASIIEKETAIPSERRRVAGVFINRLRIGMLLQTDPTVIYGITGGKHEDKGKGPLGRRLLRKDLKHDSPYNTYLYAGLPPAPIANAGAASIQAALNPEEHNYLYFVADGTGGHAFGKSLAEHNRNVAKWRKVRRNQ